MSDNCSQCLNNLAGLERFWSCKCGGPRCCSIVCFKALLKHHKKNCVVYTEQRRQRSLQFKTPPTLNNQFKTPAVLPPNIQLAGSFSCKPSNVTLATSSLTIESSLPTEPSPSSSQPSHSELNTGASVSQGQKQPHSQPRNVSGKFGTLPSKKSKEKSEAQKIKDITSSKVSKLKKAIKRKMIKIQELESGTYQKWTFESNKIGGNSNSILFETKLAVAANPPELVEEELGSEGEEDLVNLQLGEVHNTAEGSRRVRVAKKKCYICREDLGSDHSKRIVCTRKDCYRAPAHLQCLNIRCPKSSLHIIRAYYKCPQHAPKEDQREELTLVVGAQVPLPAPAVQNNNEKTQRRNDNVTAPRRVSDLLMTVLGTNQRYLTPNELRQMFAKFLKLNKDIKVDSGYVYPNHKLSLVIGPLPFKQARLISQFKEHYKK